MCDWCYMKVVPLGMRFIVAELMVDMCPESVPYENMERRIKEFLVGGTVMHLPIDVARCALELGMVEAVNN